MSSVIISSYKNKKSSIDETVLISYLKKQRPFAFAYLYDNYSAALYAVILSIVNDEQLSNDVLQESFIKIWKKFKYYKASRSRLFTWMHAVAHNCAIDCLRSRHYRNHSRYVNNPEPFFLSVKDNCINVQTIGLNKIVNKLSTNYKDVILLSYFSGYSDDEVAVILKIPNGTVKTRKRNALIKLRQMMKD